MKKSLITVTLATTLLACGSALAQVGMAGPSALSASPLSIGPTTPVGPAGIPLGAMELTTPATTGTAAGAAADAGAF